MILFLFVFLNLNLDLDRDLDLGVGSPALNVTGGRIIENAADISIPPINVLDEARLKQFILQRNGKLLVLNLWATWCMPCREEFPDLVKLADYYKGEAVEIVGLSLDYPDEVETKIKPFLKEQNVNFQIYVNGFQKDEELINFIGDEWSGGIPCTVIYDSAGNKKTVIPKAMNFEEFRDVIESFIVR